MTNDQILAIISDNALSAKGIAEYFGIDAPSEVLREIEDACWTLTETCALVAIDCRDQKHGGLFFTKPVWNR